jgi:hypothetical protein
MTIRAMSDINIYKNNIIIINNNLWLFKALSIVMAVVEIFDKIMHELHYFPSLIGQELFRI